jgi:hypothetical protein
VLLSLGSGDLLFRETLAEGGYPETLLLGTLVLLLAAWLVLSCDHHATVQRRGRRYAAYGGWGLAAGLGLWIDLLVLPWVLIAGLFLVLFCWREWRTLAPLCLLVGLFVGAIPLLAYNVTAPPGQDSLHVFLATYRTGGAGARIPPVSLGQELMGTLVVSLPVATGGSPLCGLAHSDAWPLSERSSPHTLQCSIVHAAWGLGYLALLATAAVLAALQIRRAGQRATAGTLLLCDRQAIRLHSGRLMILGSAGLTLGVFARSPAPALVPLASSRYLTGLLIAVPAVLSPLFAEGAATRCARTRAAVAAQVRTGAVLVLVAATFLYGVLSVFTELPDTQRMDQEQRALISALVRLGATRIYTDYWTCDRIAFVSRERIVCSVLDGGPNRYEPFARLVSVTRHPAYVFPRTSSRAIAYLRWAARARRRYLRIAGYVIYR